MHQTTSQLELWGGIECTINRVGDGYFNQFEQNGHNRRLEDLDRIDALGIRTLRYPLLWEQLAPESLDHIDWQWADERMQRLRELGIRPIVGLLHHGSGPKYTSLVDLHFPELLARYARAIAERYPWVDAYTPVNEPLTTARFSGLYGHWFPHGRDPLTFARALLGQLRGIVLAMKAIREVNPRACLVQTEDLGEITATPSLVEQMEFENERRWLSFDLLCGKLNRASPVWRYIRWAGISEKELLSFEAEPCPPDVLGINHYITSSRYLDEGIEKYPPHLHGGNGRQAYVDIEAVRVRPEGFCEPGRLLRDTWKRYGLPLAITEVHLGCTREEQMRWFAEIWHAALDARHSGVPVLAVTAWSLLGAYNWNSLLTRFDGHYEPGAWDLRAPEPRPTALAGMLRELANTRDLNRALLHPPGWWRRKIRFLKHLSPDDSPRDTVRKAYSPLTNGIRSRTADPCPLILITGGTGTLGQAFARLCYLRGLPYRLLTRDELDIADSGSINAAIRAFQPWAIVNTAGYVRVDDAETDSERCYRENTTGPALLAAACAESAVALMTFSSDLVFDGSKKAPYVERDSTLALNVYGWSKQLAEKQVSALCPDALIIRTSAFFGPWDSYNFVTQTRRKLQQSEPVFVPDDAVVAPTYVPDLVNAALDLLVDRESGIWHLANAGGLSWADFALEVARMGKLDAALVQGCPTDAMNWPARRPRYSILGTERGQLLASFDNALWRYFQDCATIDDDPRKTAFATPSREECATP